MLRKHSVLALFLAMMFLGNGSVAGGALTLAEDSPTSKLLQFTSGNHILGFQQGGLYIAAP